MIKNIHVMIHRETSRLQTCGDPSSKIKYKPIMYDKTISNMNMLCVFVIHARDTRGSRQGEWNVLCKVGPHGVKRSSGVSLS